MPWVRPSKDQYFLGFAMLAATRSTCLRRRVGAVIVSQGWLVATGYNGAPKGADHCGNLISGCIREARGIPSGQQEQICRAVHAEQNAIIQASSHGVKLEGTILYCTHFPCVTCLKMLINSGIHRIVHLHSYPNEFAQELCDDHCVIVESIKVKALDWYGTSET